MNTSPTPSLARPASPSWATTAAVVALACALAPVVPLLWSLPWSAPFIDGPYLSVILGIAVLVGTHRRSAGHARSMAVTALAATGGWMLLLAAFGLALRFG